MAIIVHHALGSPFSQAYALEMVAHQYLRVSATTELDMGGDVRSSICAVQVDGERFTLDKQAPVISYVVAADAIGFRHLQLATMDYPVADAAFAAEITTEATHQLRRLRRHACVGAYCGGSEVEQQAAMLGLPASEWSIPFFAETPPALCAQHHAGVLYFRSSPSEGSLPFHVATGIAHYYGVGAYRRP